MGILGRLASAFKSVLGAALVMPLAAFAQLSTTFDRFTDQTVLRAPGMEATMKEGERGRLSAQAHTFFKGKAPERVPPLVRVAFWTVSSGGWKYLNCHGVNALVDGKPFPLPEPKHKGDSLGTGVIESISVDLEWRDYVALSNAKVVEFRVCNTELPISAKRLESWRDLIKATTPRP